MKKPIILITSGPAIDDQFHRESQVLNKTYIAAVDSDYAIKSGQMRDSAALDRLFILISAIPRKNAQPSGYNARTDSSGVQEAA